MEDLGKFLVLRRSGLIVAVAEWIGTYIANIAGDPRNIVPEEGKAPPGRGIAKAVIGITVLKYLRAKDEGTTDEITLYALNNKVKGIYARHGFKVYADRNTARLVDQPLKGQKIRAGDRLVPHKTEWHDVHHMILPEADAIRLLDGLTEVVSPPADLAKYVLEKV